MAFQVGTKVDPRLNQLDFSGFAKAGEIQGQMFANMGASIGGAITEYVKKKQKKADDKASVEFLRASGAFPNMSDEQLAAGVKGAGGGSQLIQDYANIQSMTRAEESQAGKLEGQDLANQDLSARIDLNAATSPFKVTEAQLRAMQAQENYNQSLKTNPFEVSAAELANNISKANLNFATTTQDIRSEQLNANLAATRQGTAASKAGVTMAEKKMALSETLAKQTQEQNERDYNLKVEELRLKIRTAAQRDPVSAKKLEGAQTYLDDNDLIMVDGAVYEKTGWFGGKAVEVMNPSVLNIEGMEDLRRISMNMQSGFSNAASGNFEGFSMQTEGEIGQPVASDSAVTAAALESVAQPRPEGSRVGLGMERGATAIYDAAENVYDAGMDFGRGAKSLPFAAYDYLFNPSSPSFDESKARARGVTAPFFQ